MTHIERPAVVNIRAVADYLDPPDDATVFATQHSKREVGRWLHALYGGNIGREES